MTARRFAWGSDTLSSGRRPAGGSVNPNTSFLSSCFAFAIGPNCQETSVRCKPHFQLLLTSFSSRTTVHSLLPDLLDPAVASDVSRTHSEISKRVICSHVEMDSIWARWELCTTPAMIGARVHFSGSQKPNRLQLRETAAVTFSPFFFFLPLFFS